MLDASKQATTFWQRVLFSFSIGGPALFIWWIGDEVGNALINQSLGTTLVFGVTVWLASQHITKQNISKPARKLEIYLLYLIVILYGAGGIRGFIGHTFMASTVAADIGWATSPFQTELAFYHLGFGFAGFMALWQRDRLWDGLVIAKSVFQYGAAYVHIVDLVVNGNTAPSNAGWDILYMADIIVPTVMLYLLFNYRKADNMAAPPRAEKRDSITKVRGTLDSLIDGTLLDEEDTGSSSGKKPLKKKEE